MDAIVLFQRYERLARLLILSRGTVIMLLNDEDVSYSEKFLYSFMFARRIAETIFEMREIFDAF